MSSSISTQQTPPSARSDDAKLALAVRLATSLAASPMIGTRTGIRIRLGGGPGPVEWEVSEADRSAIRDGLMDLRKFAAHSEDVYIPSLHAILGSRPLRRGWGQALRVARKAWNDGQKPMVRVSDPDRPTKKNGQPNWVTPREAWELWVYREHLHADYARELRYGRLGPLGQAVVQHLARDYNAMLIEQVRAIRNIITEGLEQRLDD